MEFPTIFLSLLVNLQEFPSTKIISHFSLFLNKNTNISDIIILKNLNRIFKIFTCFFALSGKSKAGGILNRRRLGLTYSFVLVFGILFTNNVILVSFNLIQISSIDQHPMCKIPYIISHDVDNINSLH